MAASADRKLRLGVIGLGQAFTRMRPAFAAAPETALIAAADPRPAISLRRQIAPPPLS